MAARHAAEREMAGRMCLRRRRAWRKKEMQDKGNIAINKARNDELFNRKKSHPHQIVPRAAALLKDLEVIPEVSRATAISCRPAPPSPVQGATVRTDFVFSGPKLYVDASWKLPSSSSAATAGVGVYMVGAHEASFDTVFVMATKEHINSPIQAEAEALLLAAEFAEKMNIWKPTFFTDCLNLARAVAARGATDPAMLWEIRRQAIHFQIKTTPLQAKIYHAKREINGVAHECAQKARRSRRSLPTCSCRNTAHNNISCPVIAVINEIRQLGYVIHDVQCF